MIAEYKKGNKKYAYYLLGQALHLLQDNTLPAHVHDDSHGGTPFDGDDSYEDYINKVYKQYTAGNLWNSGGRVFHPYKYGEGEAVRYMMYTANQTADYFPSDNVNGNKDYTKNPNGQHYHDPLYNLYQSFNSKGYPTKASTLTGYKYCKDYYGWLGVYSETTCWSHDDIFRYHKWGLPFPSKKSEDHDDNYRGHYNLKTIADVLANDAIRYSAGMIYYFLYQTGQF